MTFLEYLNRYKIEKMPLYELKKRIDNESNIKSVTKGVVMARIDDDYILTHHIGRNNVVIRCIKSYYDNTTDNKKCRSGAKDLVCYNTQRELFGNDHEEIITDCVKCHRQCIKEFENQKCKLKNS